MRVIDSRSGREVKIGDSIEYGDGERLTLLDVDEGLFSANAVVEHTYRRMDFDTAPGYALRLVVDGPLVTRRTQIPLIVRFLHPRFLFQRVAFLPS